MAELRSPKRKRVAPARKPGNPIIHRIKETNNGVEIERELVHPSYFMHNRFIDMTAIKNFLAPWVREETRKALRDSRGE